MVLMMMYYRSISSVSAKCTFKFVTCHDHREAAEMDYLWHPLFRPGSVCVCMRVSMLMTQCHAVARLSHFEETLILLQVRLI